VINHGPHSHKVINLFATTALDAIAELQQYLGQSTPAFLLSGDTAPSVLKSISESGYRLLNKPVDGDELQKAMG
jgi:hypothetical protein